MASPHTFAEGWDDKRASFKKTSVHLPSVNAEDTGNHAVRVHTQVNGIIGEGARRINVNGAPVAGVSRRRSSLGRAHDGSGLTPAHAGLHLLHVARVKPPKHSFWAPPYDLCVRQQSEEHVPEQYASAAPQANRENGHSHLFGLAFYWY